MKSLVLALLSLGLTISAQAGQKFVVVSDIDDTIKVTHVLDKDSAIKNGIDGDRTFLGMAELYQGLRESARGIVYLSGSPPILNAKILGQPLRKFLVKEQHFPDGKFVLRKWITTDAYDFKSDALKTLAHDYNEPFVLIGDDTEKDPAVISDFAKAHPASKAPGLYIRKVSGKAEIPLGITTYYTAFEIALAEYEAGRISETAAVRVGQTIRDGKFRHLFPRFAICPDNISFVTSTPKVRASRLLVSLASELTKKIRGSCQERNKRPPTRDLSDSMEDFAKRSYDRARQKIIESVDNL